MKVLALLLLFTISLNAQHYQTYECPLSINGEFLAYPFTGGFSNPQLSEFDFNRDGLEDIYVFDKQGSASMVFLRDVNDNSLIFTKKYNQYLPESLNNFALVNDFNRDGILDIFTSGIPIGVAGVMLFQGSEEGAGYSFRVRRMGRPEGWANGLWNRLNNAQVYVATTDVPAIIDVDFDGDLDILSFESNGSYVVYNRNFQEERGFSKDTMDFNVDDICFGKFEESGLNQSIDLSSNPDVCAFAPKPFTNNSVILKSGGAHSGSTIMAFDHDEDQDMDLLIGDLLYNGLVYLKNGGTPNEDFMTDVDETYPSNSLSADMTVFLAAYNIDVDNDGLKDVIVAPNSAGIMQDYNSIWHYKNNGTGPNQFTIKQKDFLQDETLDFGSYTSPVFVDYNADGLMDLLVGHGGSSLDESVPLALALFENVGTKTNPSFNLKDDDYLGFSEFQTTSTNPAPCFGDLDSDGDLDLIIGEWLGRLYFFENIAGPGQPLEFKKPIFKYMDINVGVGAKPQIVDFNEDGLMDLVIGEERTNGFEVPVTEEFITGNLNYFQNIGTPTEPMFNDDVLASPNSSTLGQIKVSFATDTSVDGSAAPFFFKQDGKLNVIVGSDKGRMVHHVFDSTNPMNAAPEINGYLGFLKEGKNSTPSVYDIDDDGLFELIIGNSRGGLTFYQTDINSKTNTTNGHIATEKSITVFPNPSNGIFNIKSYNNKPVEMVYVLNADGKTVYQSKKCLEFDLSNLSNGIYYMKAVNKDFNIVKPIFLIK